MSKRKKLTLIGIAMLGMVIMAFGNTISYWLEQASGQLNILYSSVPINEALNSSNLSEIQKANLELLPSILHFAKNDLGLKGYDNYQKVFIEPTETTLWSLSASESFSLAPYKWYYPVIGEAGYRGFLNEKRGLKERNELRAQGWDASLGRVSAWSTLGWFNDPILSNNLLLAHGEFARLIIHELTHVTVFIPGDDVFNENLATYVGNQGALLFIKKEFGEDSGEYKNLVDRLEDIDHFEVLMQGFSFFLDRMYPSVSTLSIEEKLSHKNRAFSKIASRLREEKFNDSLRVSSLADSAITWDNTDFTDFLQYHSQQDSIHDVCNTKFGGSIKKMMTSPTE